MPFTLLGTAYLCSGREKNVGGSTSPLMDWMSGNLSSKLLVVWLKMKLAKNEAMTPLVAPCGENREDEKRKMKHATVLRLKLEKWTPGTGFQREFKSLVTRCWPSIG